MRSAGRRRRASCGSSVSASKTPITSLELRGGLRVARVSDVRDNTPFGILCEVRVPVRGLRERRDRIVAVTTSWELRDADDRPRLVTAYIDG